MARPKTQNLICSVTDCNKPTKSKGFCRNHYANFYRNGTPISSVTYKRSHPLYIIWWQRKKDNYLCDTWSNFETFINDVSPKPEGNFFLVRIRGNEPFGPDNFKWQEHLKRKLGESKKEWWSRKREARIAANPSMESNRNIKRVYGLSRDNYNEILKSQNGSCAICRNTESSVDPRTGTLKRLAVDHCHNSKKVRGLLCWRCNGTLGKIKDDIELLDKMKAYLLKHQTP